MAGELDSSWRSWLKSHILLQVIETGKDHRIEEILVILAKEPLIAASNSTRVEYFMVIHVLLQVIETE
jgi:hypothetical protein